MVVMQRVNLEGVSILLFAELSFDPKVNGAYCQLWEAFYAPKEGNSTKRSELQSADLMALPHDQFLQVAEELDSMIKYGIQTHYYDLEEQYREFMDEASFYRNHSKE